MKPLHIGLLVVGAALAGGLAVRMTQPLAIPQGSPVLRAPAPVPAQATLPSQANAAIPQKSKPSPIPAPAETVVADAPQPVYVEPAKPADRKNKPILTASAKPTQWAPIPYKTAPPPVQPAPQPAPAPDPASIEPVASPEPAPANSVSPSPAPRQVTLRTGMTIPIRLDESLSSDKSAVGDVFQASLAEPLVVDSLVIAEKNARVTGRIVDSQRAGRASGASLLELELMNVATSDGQRVAISTDPWMKQDGGQGAAVATRPQSVTLPSETVIRFRLSSRVTITEQQIAGRQ